MIGTIGEQDAYWGGRKADWLNMEVNEAERGCGHWRGRYSRRYKMVHRQSAFCNPEVFKMEQFCGLCHLVTRIVDEITFHQIRLTPL